MPKYGYLVVEGPHDTEFVTRLLRPFGLRTVQRKTELDAFFLDLIPTSYPPDDDLLKRVPVPRFLKGPTHTVAVYASGGDSRVVPSIEEGLLILEKDDLAGVGFMLDADSEISPAVRYSMARNQLRERGLHFPEDPGVVQGVSPRYGGFVLPDNQSSGTLEDILLECAAQSYSDLLSFATCYVDAAMQDRSLDAVDLQDVRKPAGKNKAVVGSIAGILRPGKAVQVSLHDNRWLAEQALKLPRVQAVQDFLKSLFDIQ
ncbi:MAG: DUF3226 domain-containing protein [Planctomycetaceae bacterium]|nr:DUF3226 domain-containing protein [Planctomycetaceae bacterium]